MKKKSLFTLGLILLLIIVVSIIYKVYSDVSSPEAPKFRYELIQDETKDGVLHFKYVTSNVGERGYAIKFLSDTEVDWSILLIKTNESSEENNTLVQNDDNEKDANEGREVFLESGEKLESDIFIPIVGLPKGEYELQARLATENIVNAPSLNLNFKID